MSEDHLTLKEGIEEFSLDLQVRNVSPRTIEYYEYCLSKLEAYLTTSLSETSPTVLRGFILQLQTYLKPNSVHAVLRGVRAFYGFLEREELIDTNPMRKIRLPRKDQTLLPSLTPDEISVLLRATEGKDMYSLRDRALLLFLLDSGVRLSEAVQLNLSDIDVATGVFKVNGKGKKERMARVGKRTLQAIRRYLRRRKGDDSDALWIGRRGRLTTYGIKLIFKRLSTKSKVHVHPHKLRRTFALSMLRNGCNVYSLQTLMGHSDLTVLRRYLAETEADILHAHEENSPVDRM